VMLDTAFTGAHLSLLSEAAWAGHGWPLIPLAGLGCALMGALDDLGIQVAIRAEPFDLGDSPAFAHDTVNVWLGRPLVLPDAVAELLANWHITHLFDNVVPVMKRAGVSDEQIDGIFIENPKRIFGG